MTGFILKAIRASKRAHHADLRAYERELLAEQRHRQELEDIARRTERLDYLTSQAIRVSTLHR